MFRTLILWIALVTGSGCSSVPLKPVEQVDLKNFMGIWYVNAHIPTSFENECKNAVEYYHWINQNKPNERPAIKNLFYCENENKKNDFVKLNAYAWVHDLKTNAEWRVQFLWPFAFEYWVIGLSSDQNEVVIGHPSRDYLWIMSRQPQMKKDRVDYWMGVATQQGFDSKKLRLVPFDKGFEISEQQLLKEYEN